MADVAAKAREPALGAIKLAWWRERLQALDAGAVPPEPRLQAALAELLPRGISGAALAELEDGWAALLEPEVDGERIGNRGVRLFAAAASLLGGGDPLLGTAGRLYAAEQVRRRGLAAESPRPTDALQRLAGHRFARPVRPLTALAALAARDARRNSPEAEATPGRALALIAHRLTGRVA